MNNFKSKKESSLATSQKKLKILIYYDEHGWAWWHRAHNIKSCISNHFTIDIAKINANIQHTNYDYILLFESYLYQYIKHVPTEKIIIGSSTLKTLDKAILDYQTYNFSGLIVNNLESYKKIRYLNNTFYCPNGVDEKLFTYKFPRCDIITGCWVGNNASMNKKGLDLIQEACQKTSINLITLDQANNVYTGDILTHTQVRDQIYHNSTFYICASEMEGTPNPSLESLSCGLPVISTRVGNMPEVISNGYNGYLVERNIDSLCEGIEKMKHSNLHSMSINARESILKGWTWKQQATRYIDAFYKINKNRIKKTFTRIKSNNKSLIPTVSVIIPTHNRPQELLEAIESVRNQSFQNFEMIVVNDCGYNIKNLLKKLNDPRIVYTSHSINKGLAAARNTGIKLARGKYIAYLDDDDQFFEDHLQVLVNFLETSNFKVAYTNGERNFLKEINMEKISINKLVEHSHDFDPIRLLICNYIPVLCLMHERSCLNEVGFFDEKLPVHEDWDLWIRLSRMFPFKHINATTCTYHTIVNKPNSLTTSRQVDFIKTMQIIYRKHKHFTSLNKSLFFLQKKSLVNLISTTFQLRDYSDIHIDDDFNITLGQTLENL